jgi:DNA polymerase-3 subunit delta'
MAKRSAKADSSAPKSKGMGLIREIEIHAPEIPEPTHPPAQPLSSILGQDRAIATLQAAFKSGRIHHAWIFQGPQGVGKFSTALAFAALLLDPSTAPTFSGDFAADDNSPIQRLIRAGTHPDLHVISKELALYSEVKTIRDSKQITIAKDVVETHLLGPAALAPSLRNNALAAKVFIVDEAELLDRSASHAPTQAALLKTLEEPPERTVIILVTSSEDRLLTTIRSRCQRVAFPPLPPDAMIAYLKREKIALDPNQRDWLLALADGSPGVLKLALEANLYSWHEKLEPMLARAKQGHFVPELGATLAALIEEWAEHWVKSHKNASKEAANKSGADWAFRILSDSLRKDLALHARDEARAECFAQAIDCVRLAERRLDSNVSIPMAMEVLAADLAACCVGESMLH